MLTINDYEIQYIGHFFNFFASNWDKRKLIVYGGAGSGKSVATAQWLIKMFLEEEDKVFLIIRNTLPAIKITCFVLMNQILNAIKEQTGEEFPVNLSDLTIKNPGRGNVIYFKSIDDEEKIKSFEANYIWIEEATEITFEKYMQLNLRLRRHNIKNNQMFLTFNPISIHHWLYKKVICEPSKDTAVHHSTWLDNPFLPEEYIKQLASLAREDLNYFSIYAKGEWGQVGNLIYSNYVIEDVESWRFNPDKIYYGLDFGFNAETALTEIMEYDKEFYVRELLYQTKLTNTDLINKLKILIKDRRMEIFADSAEPARIAEILDAGFNCQTAEKDVLDGIDFVKRHKLHIDSNSINLIEEIQNYSYKKDKDGNILEEPIKFNDHLCDSLRYALYTNWLRNVAHKPSGGVVFY